MPLTSTTTNLELARVGRYLVRTGLVTILSTDRFTDARFEVLGSPFSLLSVSLSASQNLYTRRGSLVGLGGKPENVQSRSFAIEVQS